MKQLIVILLLLTAFLVFWGKKAKAATVIVDKPAETQKEAVNSVSTDTKVAQGLQVIDFPHFLINDPIIKQPQLDGMLEIFDHPLSPYTKLSNSGQINDVINMPLLA